MRRSLSFFVTLCVCALMHAGVLRAQTLSGTVNNYAAVIAIDDCRSEVIVGDASQFSAGDRVLIIQMQGATIDKTQSSQFGSITSLGTAGLFEFGTVKAVKGTRIKLTKRLANLYDATGAIQILKAATVTDGSVAGSVTAPSWDGGKGGVIAIEASGTLTVDGTIDASGKGFRGGGASAPLNGVASSIQEYYTAPASGRGAEKGESLSKRDFDKSEGRGKHANAGGGGNANNAGGGGGGGLDAGGVGGNQSELYGNDAIGGIGGQGIQSVLPAQHKIAVMGGGGGGGQQNDNSGTAGASGGGIIIIRAQTLAGNGSIIATGAKALDAKNDGAGGGGGGGAVVLDVKSVTGKPNVNVSGGNGGSVNSDGLSTYCFGPGGGGAGGMILLTTNVASSLQTTIAGGAAGLVTTAAASCVGTSYGAAAGLPGGVVDQGVIVEGTIDAIEPSALQHTATICLGDPLLLEASGGTTYSWTPAIDVTTPSAASTLASPKKSMTFKVSITDTRGCVFVDSVQITVRPKPTPTFTGTNPACANSLEMYASSDANVTNFNWVVDGGTLDAGQGSSTATVRWGNVTSGALKLFETNAEGCVDSFIMAVTLNKPDVGVTASSLILRDQNDQVTLSSATDHAQYDWSDGQSGKSVTITTPGTYALTVTDANGCSATSDSVTVILLAPASALVELPTLEAAPGEMITVPIVVKTSQNIPLSGATGFIAKIKYDNSIMVPKGTEPVVMNGRESILTFNGAVGADTVGEFGKLTFLVALGATRTAPIRLESFEWQSANRPITNTLTDGALTVTNLCEGGGTRLFSPDGTLLLQAVSPNPAMQSTSIHYELLEAGLTKLSICDVLGREVKTVFNDMRSAGAFDESIDLTQIAQGRYFLVLQTPTARLQQGLMISRH